MAITSLNTSRLRSQLMTSGLQQKDSPLFQVINSLIGGLEFLNEQLRNATGGTGTTTTIQQIQEIHQHINFGDGDGEGEQGPPGLRGIDGTSGAAGPAGATGFPIFFEADYPEEILSIPGPTGPQGATGSAGPTGSSAIGFVIYDGNEAEENIMGDVPSENAKLNGANIFVSRNSFKSYFSPLFDNGNSGATKTIDWNNGNDQYLVLDSNCVLTFSNPVDGGRYVLLVKGGFTITWPSDVVWAGGTAPTISGSTKHDLFTFMYKSSLSKYVSAFNLDYTL